MPVIYFGQYAHCSFLNITENTPEEYQSTPKQKYVRLNFVMFLSCLYNVSIFAINLFNPNAFSLLYRYREL